MNKNKSLLFVPEDDTFSQNPLPSDIPIARDGFVLPGSPVGSQSFCSSYISSRVKKIQDIIPLLPDLKTPRWKVLCCAHVSASLNFPFLYELVLQVTSRR